MTESWWEAAEADRKEAIAFASSTLGRPPHVLEKDVWVVWALQHLFASTFGPSLTFKGGTSLSKVFQVIDRFSEDIDLTINIRDFLSDELVGGNPLPASRNHVKRIHRAIDTRLPQWLDDSVIPSLRDRISETNQHLTVSRPVGSLDTLVIDYKPVFRSAGYLLPRVKLEFGARTTGLPRARHQVVADMAATIPSMVFPVADVFVLAPERTFWEKTTAIHVYCSQARPIADRFSRHWSDVVALWRSGHGVSALVDKELALDVAGVKQAFYAARDRNGEFVDYRRAVTGEISLVPAQEQMQALRSDYQAMESDGLLELGGPSFDDLMEMVAEIEKEMNFLTGSA